MLTGTLITVPTTSAELLPAALSARLDGLDILSRKLLAGKLQGERRSKRRGRSVEFDDYREYTLGDDLRHIDWNVLARLDRFFIKVFQEEEDLALQIVLDASASMNAGAPDEHNKLLFGARLAAALGYIGLVNNNRVRLTIIGPRGVKQLEPLRGRRSAERVTQFLLQHAFESLAAAPATGVPQLSPGEAFTAALRACAGGAAGRGVLAVISDFFIAAPGYEPGLRMLASAGTGGNGRAGTTSGALDVFLMQTLAPSELDPLAGERGPAMLGDLRLMDAETGAAAEVTITPELAAAYQRTLRQSIENLRAFAARLGLHHQLVRTDIPLHEFIVNTLRRAGLLK
ncbi:DUF58 domain-containing protein [soil metagenome]